MTRKQASGKSSARYNYHFKRQKRLWNLLLNKKQLAFLVTNLVNIRYLTGFHCTYGYLLFAGGKSYFLTDARYTADARSGAVADEIIEIKATGAYGRISEVLGDQCAKRLAFEAESMTVDEFENLRKHLKKIRPVPEKQLVEHVRLVKDETEIACIRDSSRIMDRAFAKLIDFIKPGVTEASIKAKLETELIGSGIDGISFDTIVASGPRAAFAHGKPSERRIAKGDFVVIDFGVCTKGYHSDMTRTVFVGVPTAEDRRRYRAVIEAQRDARNAAKSGVDASEPDRIARETLAKFHLSEYFTHGLGHGVGLDIHERPRLSPVGSDKLTAGMVFTIEPGIYIENWGGIRIEDTFILTKEGPVAFNRSPHSLIFIQ